MLLMNGHLIYNMKFTKSIICQELSSKEMINLMKKLHYQGFLFHTLELYIEYPYLCKSNLCLHINKAKSMDTGFRCHVPGRVIEQV